MWVRWPDAGVKIWFLSSIKCLELFALALCVFFLVLSHLKFSAQLHSLLHGCSHLYLCSGPLAFSYKIDLKIHGLCYPFLIRCIFCWNVIFTNIPFRFYFHVSIQSWNNQEVSLYSLLFILIQCLFSRTMQNRWLVFSL